MNYSFSDRLKLLMQKKGMSTQELADAAGLTAQAIRDYLRDLKMPSAKSIGTLAKALGTSTDYLIYGRESTENSAASRGKRSILFVDDQMWAVEPYVEVLRREGYEVTLVPSAYEALQELKQREFDLGIFDIILNESRSYSGLFLLEICKRHQFDFPVIILTGCSTTKSVKFAFQQGASDYLEKPVDLIEITEAVRKAIDRRVRSDPRRFQDVETAPRPEFSDRTVLSPDLVE